MLTSLFFVLSHHALESALTPGSVAYNIILSPFFAFLYAFISSVIGPGQAKPLLSILYQP